VGGYYVATTTSAARARSDKAYNNPAKLGGEPVYATIKEMEAVSHYQEMLAYVMY
jgi:hypothetical protein